MTPLARWPADQIERSHAAPTAVVCDADDVSSRILARTLSHAGFAVSVCGTAADCEAKVKEMQPDLAVLAVLLPDLDGLALTRRLKQLETSPRILIVSALQAKQRAIEAGADAFLLKPVPASVLTEAAQNLLSLEHSA